MALTGGNYLFIGLLHLPYIPANQYYLGLFYNFATMPSLISLAALSLGIHFSIMIARQGLNLFTPLSKLSRVELNSAPMGYYAEMGLIFTQLLFLGSAVNMSFCLNIINSLDIGLLIPVMFVSMISLQVHSFSLNKKISDKNRKFDIHSICFSLLLALSLYISAVFGVQKDLNYGS